MPPFATAQAACRRAQCQRSAGHLQIALQREHQAVAVDDARLGRQQCGRAVQRRLELPRLRGRKPLQFDTVGGGLLARRLERGMLFRRGGHHQLAAAPVRHAVRNAEIVELRAPPHAQPRLQRTGRVIQTRVDHLAVARARTGADGVRALQHDGLQPAARQRASDRQPHHASTNHERIDSFHAHDSRNRARRHGPLAVAYVRNFGGSQGLRENPMIRDTARKDSPCPP